MKKFNLSIVAAAMSLLAVGSAFAGSNPCYGGPTGSVSEFQIYNNTSGTLYAASPKGWGAVSASTSKQYQIASGQTLHIGATTASCGGTSGCYIQATQIKVVNSQGATVCSLTATQMQFALGLGSAGSQQCGAGIGQYTYWLPLTQAPQCGAVSAVDYGGNNNAYPTLKVTLPASS